MDLKKKQTTLTNKKTGQTITVNAGSGTRRAIQSNKITSSGSSNKLTKVPSSSSTLKKSGASSSASATKPYKNISGASDLVYRGKPKSHEQAKKEWINAERDFFTRQKAEGTNSLEKAIGKATPLKNSSKKVSKKVKY